MVIIIPIDGGPFYIPTKKNGDTNRKKYICIILNGVYYRYRQKIAQWGQTITKKSLPKFLPSHNFAPENSNVWLEDDSFPFWDPKKNNFQGARRCCLLVSTDKNRMPGGPKWFQGIKISNVSPGFLGGENQSWCLKSRGILGGIFHNKKKTATSLGFVS